VLPWLNGELSAGVGQYHYIEQVLVPTLRDRRVVVMDNLSSHKGERAKELIEGREVRAYLPAALLAWLQPYREQAFSKIKNFLREVRARVYEVLVEAIGKALWAIIPGDSQGFFEHRGYYAMDQSL
jgi:hypothetical protein